MAGTLNDLKVNLSLDNGEFKVTVRDSERMLKSFEQKLDTTASAAKGLEDRFSGFGSSLYRATMTLGMARFALMDLHDVFLKFPLAILKTSGEIEKMQTLMEGLSKESDVAKRKLEAVSGVKFVLNLAQSTPFEVKALTDAYVKLKTGGIDPTNGSLKALTDSVARFGGNSETLHRASIAIQQMAGKGVISMEELRQQLGEAVPTAMASMARGMGISMQDLTKFVSSGMVESKSALSKMFAAMAYENDGAAAKMMGTWTGMIERLKTKWELFKLDIGNQGMFDGAKAALNDLLNVFDSSEGRKAAEVIGTTLNSATENGIALVHTLVNMSEEIKTAGELFLFYWGSKKVAGMLQPAVEAMRNFGKEARAASDSIAQKADTARVTALHQAEAEASALRAQIAANEQSIAAEKAETAARRAELLQRVRDEIAANELIMENNRRRINDARDFREGMSRNPLVAQGGVAGAMTFEQRQVVAGLRAQADEMDKLAAVASNHNRVLQEQTDKLKEHSVLLRTTGAATTANILSKQSENAELRNQVTHLDGVARGLESTTAKGNLFAGAVKAIGLELKALATPLNILMIGIFAAAEAWSFFSSRADEAIAKAKAALDLEQQLKSGKGKRETADLAAKDLADKSFELQRLKTENGTDIYDQETGFKTGRKYDHTALIKELEEKIKKDREVLMEYSKLAVNDDAAAIARRTVEKINEHAATEMAKMVSAHTKAETELADKINELAAQDPSNKNTAIQAQLRDLNGQQDALRKSNAREGLVKKLEIIGQERAKLIEKGKTLTEGSTDFLAVQESLKQVNRDYTNIAGQVSALDDPKKLLSSKNDTPHLNKSPLEQMIAAKEAEAARLELHMQNIANNTRGAAALQQEARAYLDELAEGGRFKRLVHGKDKDGRPVTTEVDDSTNPAMMARAEAAIARQKLATSANATAEALRAEMARMQSSETSSAEQLDDGVKVGTTFKQATAFFNKLRADMEKSGGFKAVEEMLAKNGTSWLKLGSDINKAAATTDLNNFVGPMVAQTRQLNSQLILVDRERREQTFREEQALLDRTFQERYKAAIQAGKTEEELEEQSRIYSENMKARQLKHIEDMKTPLEKLGDTWRDVTKQMEDASARWANNTIDAIMDVIKTGKFNLGNLIQTIALDIVRAKLQAQYASGLGNLFSSLGSAAVSWISGGTSTGADPKIVTPTPAPIPHANGGVMTEFGPAALRKYANGGIANSPQLALFGEGSMAEAYVPLPDGRSIPVTLRGQGQSQQGSAVPSVTVNVINQSGQQVGAQQGQPRFDGKQMILDIVLTSANTPGPFRDGMKNAFNS